MSLHNRASSNADAISRVHIGPAGDIAGREYAGSRIDASRNDRSIRDILDVNSSPKVG
jgi:hypothetical protein